MGDTPTYGLPYATVVIDQPRPTTDTLLRLESMMVSKTIGHGYVTIDHGGACDVLLLYNSAIHSAVRLEGAGVAPLEVVEFFRGVKRDGAGRMRMCRTDPGLILLAAVAFQNNPVVKGTATVADLERLLADVAARKGAAVIQLVRARDRTFAYCRDGQPVAVYFGTRTHVPAEESPRDQLLAYGYLAPADTTVCLFYDLQSRRDEHAERSFEDLLAARVGPPEFLLTVMHGSERVQRRLLQGGRAKVGRDPTNDISIDHLSVSRHHCTIEWRTRAFFLEDGGSVNGTRVNGNAVDGEQQLEHGDRITVGDFDILFGSGAAASSEHELRTVFLEPDPAAAGQAQLVRDGEAIGIAGTVFKIGKSRDADLRLRGLFMRPIQATIVREAPGMYRLLPVAGGRAVRVGGQDVPAGGVILETGTAIRVGGHDLVFVLTDA